MARLPAALRDAGQLAGVGHLAEADPAQAELLVDRVRSPTALAARVAPHLELGGAVGLVDEGLLSHGQFSLKGKPSCLSSARPSSTFVAVVTTVMSMPRTRSMESMSISWNIDCSVRPTVELPRPSNWRDERPRKSRMRGRAIDSRRSR